ncbi:MAG: InlB B-repeat-containing protein [Treponema sp.]|nr:InlB B-repeat-containing protein [Treponema sp.]
MRSLCRLLLRNIAGILALVVCVAVFMACADPTELPTFTVRFNLNDGSGIPTPAPQTVDAGSAITLPSGTGLSRYGYVFGGWNTTADGTGTNFNAGASFTPSGNITLYARWNQGLPVTVRFDNNGGTGTIPSLTATQGSAVMLPSGAGFSRLEFTFAGWNTNRAGTGTEHLAGSSFTPLSDITLYARWVPTVIVSFNSNSGSGTVPAQAVGQGLSMMLPSGGGLSRTGYAFDGWNERSDGIGINHSAGSMFTPHNNITLYARWVSVGVGNFTVTFDANGATSGTVPPLQTVPNGTVITIPGRGTLQRSGYTFNGWNTNVAGTGTNHAAGASFTVTGNTTLFANWVPVVVTNFTVTFNANGATSGTVPSLQTVPSGTVITLPGQGTLQRSGHTFNGWNTNAAGTGTNHSADTSFTVTGNVTLFARWISVGSIHVDPNVVGTWNRTDIFGDTLVLNSDGTGTIQGPSGIFSLVFTAHQGLFAVSVPSIGSAHGTYSIAGNIVTINFISRSPPDVDFFFPSTWSKGGSSFVGTWSGNIGGMSVSVIATAAGTWSLVAPGAGILDQGTFTMHGNTATLFSQSIFGQLGTASLVDNNTVVLTLSHLTDFPGIHTLTRVSDGG